MAKQSVSAKAKDGFTRLWGVRFNEAEAQLIEEEAEARDVKPGTYIRQAAMESARLHRRARVQ
jgi:hypothetical protein